MSPDALRVNKTHQCGTDIGNARKYNLTLTLTLALNTRCIMYGTLLRPISFGPTIWLVSCQQGKHTTHTQHKERDRLAEVFHRVVDFSCAIHWVVGLSDRLPCLQLLAKRWRPLLAKHLLIQWRTELYHAMQRPRTILLRGRLSTWCFIVEDLKPVM